MPAWTLSDLMSNATAALGNRVDIAASTVSFWVNQAYEDVWNILPHDQHEAIAVSSTTVNEDKLGLPSDFLSLIVLSNTSRSNALLDPINQDQIAAFSASSGQPTHYAQFSSWLELRPVPDSAYSLELRYRKLRSELTLTTDTPSVATRLRPAIYHRAVALLAQNVTLDSAKAIEATTGFRQALAIPSDRALRTRDQHALGCSLSWRGRTGLTSRSSFDLSVT